MTWALFAFLSAFSLATADALSKRALKSTDDLVIVWVREGYALPFLAVAFLFVPVPALDPTFWVTVATLIPLEILALILYVKAIRLSPLSLSVPFMAFTPAFIMFIAFVILGETPDASGFSGIVLIALGAYLLNIGAFKQGVLGPIKAIGKEPGSVLMLIVALIYSVTATLGKVAVGHSSPFFFGFFYPFLLTVMLSGILIAKGRLRGVAAKPFVFLPIGLCAAVMILSHFIAISLADVAYMIAIKRTSLLFSVLYGRLFFGEEAVGERLLGAGVMLAGVVLITAF
ncbi:MAG: EamA family transporter [Deltaproteobacteria bacterium]|nr:EamA family transporter [Deltaproteobacteria bacterium]